MEARFAASMEGPGEATQPDLMTLLPSLTARLPEMLADLRAWCGIDCGTATKAGVDQVGMLIAERCAGWGWGVERLPLSTYGDCWRATLRGTGAGRVMLMGHLDTVYPPGTVAERPLRVEADRPIGPDRLIGPGVCDMKGGLVVGLYAMRALEESGFDGFGELTFFFNSDEEVGSPESRKYCEPLARAADAVLVLESARANGDIVSARKGSGEYRLTAIGRAAHAGVEPEKGINAVLEIARQIEALHALNGLEPGVTVNAGLIGGGIATNVVPDSAWVEFDVRAIDAAGAKAVQAALEKLQPILPGARLTLSGSFSYPPMARTPAIARLVALAQAAARDSGFTVNDAATGGASDANVIAGWDVPVLDGLGPIGGLDHSPDEYIEIDSLAPRSALVAGLISRILRAAA